MRLGVYQTPNLAYLELIVSDCEIYWIIDGNNESITYFDGLDEDNTTFL